MHRYRTIMFFGAALIVAMHLLPPASSPSLRDHLPVPWTNISSAQAQEAVTAEGTIKESGFTSYMYGTHVLVDGEGKTLYALKSESINLDLYVGRKVTLSGIPVDGYPVDNGPGYLNVKTVRD